MNRTALAVALITLGATLGTAGTAAAEVTGRDDDHWSRRPAMHRTPLTHASMSRDPAARTSSVVFRATRDRNSHGGDRSAGRTTETRIIRHVYVVRNVYVTRDVRAEDHRSAGPRRFHTVGYSRLASFAPYSAAPVGGFGDGGGFGPTDDGQIYGYPGYGYGPVAPGYPPFDSIAGGGQGQIAGPSAPTCSFNSTGSYLPQ